MKFEPAAPCAGFRMAGYYVWCGSVLPKDGRYYLFAARWPEKTGFPDGYMTHSEIVLASSDTPEGPYTFDRVLLPGRGDASWDGKMTHNPSIFSWGGRYYLFYIGTPDGRFETRTVGCAWAEDIRGPWHRADAPFALPPNANNPAAVEADGKVRLYFRDGELRVSCAEASRPEGPYTLLAEDLFPGARVEDMFVWRDSRGWHMIAEDDGGSFTGVKKGGVLFDSEDGLAWRPAEDAAAYGFTVEQTDGTVLSLDRRERPVLLFDPSGTWLFTAAKMGGDTRLTGGKTWNLVQKVKTE